MFPDLHLRKEIMLSAIAGIILSWMVTFFSRMGFGPNIRLGPEIAKLTSMYRYFAVFLIVLWGPFLEEVLARSYFFELLRRQLGAALGLIISSMLFLVPHGIWGGFDFALIFIFLYSAVFTFVYIQGGIIASIIVHAFVNSYLVYMSFLA